MRSFDTERDYSSFWLGSRRMPVVKKIFPECSSRTSRQQSRDAAGLTQLDLAARLDLPQSRISEHERGIREPGSVTLWRLARALGVSADSLLE